MMIHNDRIQELDPLNYECIPIYISTMVGLHKKSELFYCGHSLVRWVCISFLFT